MGEDATINDKTSNTARPIASRTAADPTLPQLFVQDGEPIKFFIQRDTGTQFISWLANTITKHGGRVVQVVPLSGYVLIDPSTKSGLRIRQKWMMPESRPSRHVVCYTFVRASVVGGTLVSPEEMEGVTAFFRHINSPVEFYLHPALDKALAKKAAVDIEKYGGVTDTTEESACVIITPDKTKKKEIILWNDLVRKHETNENKYIEDLQWVYRCIETKTLEKTVHRKKDLGGRKPGQKRIEFTEEDDQNLIKFIAEKIPYLETGGRLGNNLYLELVKNKSLYPWAQRHSWHSWRNRYKTRSLIFDVAIREYVNQHPVGADGTRPPHPALIPLDNARDESDNNIGANDKRKKQKKKRIRQPSPSDSHADDASSRHDFDSGEGGEEEASAGERRPRRHPPPKRPRRAAADISVYT